MDSIKNRALAVVFFIIVHFSTLGIIRQFNLDVPDLVNVPWETMGMINSGVQFLRPECAGGGGMSDFSIQFTLRSLLPIFVGLFFFMSFCLSVVLKAIFASHKGKPGVLGVLALGMELRPIVNAFGTLMYTFSIAILAMAFDLFKCFEHPNKLSSMRVAPDVLCGEATWNSLLIVGIFSIALYCFGSFTLFSWVCWVAPKRFPDRTFRQTWKFLLVKWKPNRWWFGQIFIAKGVFLTLPLIIFQSGAMQAVWAGITLMSYSVALMILGPWRHNTANILDAFTNLSLLSIALISVYFSAKTDEATNTLDKFVLIFTCIPLLVCFCALGRLGWRFLKNPDTDIIERTRSALIIAHKLENLAKTSSWQIIRGCANLTSREMEIVHASFDMISYEARGQCEAGSRLVQRQVAFDHGGKPAADDNELKKCSAQLSKVLQPLTHKEIGASKQDYLKEPFMTQSVVEAMDIFEEGHVRHEVYKEFVTTAKALDAESHFLGGAQDKQASTQTVAAPPKVENQALMTPDWSATEEGQRWTIDINTHNTHFLAGTTFSPRDAATPPQSPRGETPPGSPRDQPMGSPRSSNGQAYGMSSPRSPRDRTYM